MDEFDALERAHHSISYEKSDQRGQRYQMKHGMQSVWGHSIATRQDRGCTGEDNLIACRPLRVRENPVGYPPGTEYADDEYAVSDPEQHLQPVRVGSAKVFRTEKQANRR